MEKHMNNKFYHRLLVMIVLYFALMYFLMYAMVNKFDNIVNNLNQVYMAALMTFPMVVLELILIEGMYHKKILNFLVIGVSVVIFVLSLVFIRHRLQFPISNF